MNYCLFALISISICLPIAARSKPPPDITNTAKDLCIEDSSVLQRWQRQVPNVLEDIKNDPSFRNRLRLGFNRFSTRNGVNIGVEDVFIGQTRITSVESIRGLLGRKILAMVEIYITTCVLWVAM